MYKFFNYYNSLCTGANTPGVFSYDPYIIAVKEMLISELQQVVYYIEKLKDLNIDMNEYTDKVVEFISVLIVNLDFRRESFFVIVEDLYNNKKKLEEMYITESKKISEEPILLSKDKIELSGKETIIKALNEHEKNRELIDEEIYKNKRTLHEIMINIVLNACNCLIELKSYNVDFTAAKDEVLKLLNNSNFPALSDNEWKEKISNFAKCNYKILKLLYEVIIKKFGTIEKKEILISPKKGKAILVSGSSYSDLEKILKLAAKSGINVYTHHEMLSAHEYEQLNKYENLKGHYQHFSNSFPLDFAEFPGPIYISGNSIPKLDVIRGQIYTSAKYPPFGIGKIENNDFSPLIVYAQNSTGFLKDSDEKTMVVGFSYCEIENILEDIINKFNTESIKKLFIIGLSNPFNNNTDYLKKFIKECPEDYYIMSFGYDSKRKNNFFKVNSFYDFSAVYYIIEKLSEKTETLIENTAVFLTDCTYNTVSHIFNLLYSGIKNIFLGTCCPDTINPKMVEGLNNLYGIHKLTTPYEDIKKIK